MVENENIYSRENGLWKLYNNKKEYRAKHYSTITVVGIGGIGSWVALDVALAGLSEKLILVDNDRVEEHNLNRTPFKALHIGMYKTEALKQLILERRDTSVDVYNEIYEFLPNEVKKQIAKSVIIDCRDSLENINYRTDKVIYLRYDGISMTVMPSLPDSAFISGNRGYDITPSILMPPQFVASLVSFILKYNISIKTATFNLFNVLEQLSIMIGDDAENDKEEQKETGK